MNPSTSFQRGDRVKATNTLFKMHGTVERIQAFTGLVRVRWDNRPGLFGSTVAAFSEWVHSSHLALLSREVSQATFSKGDVVEITRPHPSPEYVGALGVVVKILTDRPTNVPRIQVKPYKPSKPFEKLSNGPFTYSARELTIRRANGLVPVNFVREAMGLEPAPRPAPAKWTVVGTTDTGADVLFASPLGTPPPKVADLVNVKGTPRGLEATFQVHDEVSAWLDALARPTSIRISDAMRRRGITTEGDVRQIDDANKSLTQRNASLSAKLDEANRRLDQQERSATFNDQARTAEAGKLRAERDELKRALGHARRAVETLSRLGNEFDLAALQDELHRAHVSRQQAENRADALEAEVRDLKNQLGAAVNRSRRRGEAIERVQNAVRGL